MMTDIVALIAHPGRAVADRPDLSGKGDHDAVPLPVDNRTLSGNSAGPGSGGGIITLAGPATVKTTTFVSNSRATVPARSLPRPENDTPC